MDRNLDPELITKEVIAARWLWGHRYSQQRGGQVDFYEKLPPSEKRLCREMVDAIGMCELRSAPGESQ
jgi:hypothetical protein